MDEPGAGLAQDESDRLRDVIKGLYAHCGAQVLLVDHDVDLISAVCSATLVLDFGSRQAPAARGVGVLLIEQFTHLALKISDAAYVMERGRICFSGEPQELVRNPDILHSAYLA